MEGETTQRKFLKYGSLGALGLLSGKGVEKDRNCGPNQTKEIFTPDTAMDIDGEKQGTKSQLKSSEQYFENGGDYEDYAFTLASILNESPRDFDDIRPTFELTKKNGGWEGHVSLEFDEEGQTYISDTVLDQRRGYFKTVENYLEDNVEDRLRFAYADEDGALRVHEDAKNI